MSPILFYDNFFGSLRFPLGLNRNNKPALGGRRYGLIIISSAEMQMFSTFGKTVC